jgi:hypothetical protein
MAQKQGSSSANGGRLDGALGTAVVAGDIAIGAGWGSAATKSVRSGSTDQRGSVTITASTTTPAQATATVALTFADGAFAAVPPFYSVTCAASSQSITDPQPTAVACTTTALTWTSAVLPVDTKTYQFNWLVVS